MSSSLLWIPELCLSIELLDYTFGPSLWTVGGIHQFWTSGLIFVFGFGSPCSCLLSFSTCASFRFASPLAASHNCLIPAWEMIMLTCFQKKRLSRAGQGDLHNHLAMIPLISPLWALSGTKSSWPTLPVVSVQRLFNIPGKLKIREVGLHITLPGGNTQKTYKCPNSRVRHLIQYHQTSLSLGDQTVGELFF